MIVIFSFIIRSKASGVLEEQQVPNNLKGLDVHSIPVCLSW